MDAVPLESGKECEDIYRRGGKDSQMYLVQPDAFFPPYKVFCDQTTQNGGENVSEVTVHLWHKRVLQRRLCLLSQAGSSSRTDSTAAWTSAVAGTNIVAVLETSPSTAARVTVRRRVRLPRAAVGLMSAVIPTV